VPGSPTSTRCSVGRRRSRFRVRAETGSTCSRPDGRWRSRPGSGSAATGRSCTGSGISTSASRHANCACGDHAALVALGRLDELLLGAKDSRAGHHSWAPPFRKPRLRPTTSTNASQSRRNHRQHTLCTFHSQRITQSGAVGERRANRAAPPVSFETSGVVSWRSTRSFVGRSSPQPSRP